MKAYDFFKSQFVFECLKIRLRLHEREHTPPPPPPSFKALKWALDPGRKELRVSRL